MYYAVKIGIGLVVYVDFNIYLFLGQNWCMEKLKSVNICMAGII